MAVPENQSKTLTFTMDGTGILNTVDTVPAGETWYIDTCYVDNPTGELDGSADFACRPTANASDYDNVGLVLACARGGSSLDRDSAVAIDVDEYATSGDDILFAANQEPSSGTLQVTIIIKRVL